MQMTPNSWDAAGEVDWTVGSGGTMINHWGTTVKIPHVADS